jgi:hypothetical protein
MAMFGPTYRNSNWTCDDRVEDSDQRVIMMLPELARLKVLSRTCFRYYVIE